MKRIGLISGALALCLMTGAGVMAEDPAPPAPKAEGGGGQGGGGRQRFDPAQMRKQMMELREANDARIGKILTPTQMEEWNKMRAEGSMLKITRCVCSPFKNGMSRSKITRSGKRSALA